MAHGYPTAPLINRWRILQIPQQDASELSKWRRSNDRAKWAKSVAILGLSRGTSITHLGSKLEKSLRVIKRWRKAYIAHGLDGLRSPQRRKQNQDKQPKMVKTTDPARWRILDIPDQDAAELNKWRRSANRIKWSKAVAILELNRETHITHLC
jgi:hypothetical protein